MTSLAGTVGGTASIVAGVTGHHGSNGEQTGPLAYLGGSDAQVGRQCFTMKTPGYLERRVSLGDVTVELYTVPCVSLSLEPKRSNVRQNLNPAKTDARSEK